MTMSRIEYLPLLLKMAKITQSTQTTSASDLARALMKQEGDISLARAGLQAMRKLLTEAEKLPGRGIKGKPGFTFSEVIDDHKRAVHPRKEKAHCD